jgi:hypothetical protein
VTENAGRWHDVIISGLASKWKCELSAAMAPDRNVFHTEHCDIVTGECDGISVRHQMIYAFRMVFLRHLFAKSGRAAACAVVAMLSACGGGGGSGGAGSGAATPAGQDIPAQPAAAGTGAVPALPVPEGGVAPPMPPATDATQPSATGAMAPPAAGGMPAPPEQAVTIGTPVATALPAGATPCQPSTCPPFSANGSVTNTRGSDDPTQANGYLVAPSQASAGGYPDLANLPTLILPAVSITVGNPPM